MSLTHIRALTLLLFAALAIGGARAQPRATVEIGVASPYANESFPVTVTVHGVRRVGDVAFPPMSDAAVQFGRRSSRTSSINGQLSSSVTLAYRIAVSKPGLFTIPPFAIPADGRTIMTEAVQFTVRDPADRPTSTGGSPGAALLSAEVICGASKLYVGQSAPFTLTISIRPPIAAGRYLRPTETLSFVGDRRVGIGPFPRPREATQRRIPDTDGDLVVQEFTSRADLVMTDPGPVLLDDVVISMDYPTRFRQDIFGSLRAERTRKLTIRPSVLAPDVLPLPSDGRPDAFNGAVGHFEIRTSLTTDSSVRVGDPIELVIEIRGRGGIETLRAPRTHEQHTLTDDFRVPEEVLAGQYDIARNRKRFTQVVRAKHVGIDAIPPIEFPYFDPKLERFVIALSEPIPISVHASASLTADDVTGPIGQAEAADAALEDAAGLNGNIVDADALLQREQRTTTQNAVVALVVPPGVLLVVVAGLHVLSRRDNPARVRARRAHGVALARLDDATNLSGPEMTAAVVSAFVSYVADRLNSPRAKFTGRTAIDALRECSAGDDLLRECDSLLAECEAGAYGKAAASSNALIDRARECLTRLEQSR